MSSTKSIVSSKEGGNENKSYTAKQVRIIKAVIGSLKAVAAVSCHAIQFEKPTTKNKQRYVVNMYTYYNCSCLYLL